MQREDPANLISDHGGVDARREPDANACGSYRIAVDLCLLDARQTQ
jgi:hypothetical protein